MTSGDLNCHFAFGLAEVRDLTAIAALEARPEYRGLVGSWAIERHEEEFASPNSRYLVLRQEADLRGYALLQGFLDPDAKLHLKRIVVRDPGCGQGSLLLNRCLSWIYAETSTNRVDLDVFVHNERAQRAYEKVGFQREGILRDYHKHADGTFVSMWMMSILRADWLQSKM